MSALPYRNNLVPALQEDEAAVIGEIEIEDTSKKMMQREEFEDLSHVGSTSANTGKVQQSSLKAKKNLAHYRSVQPDHIADIAE